MSSPAISIASLICTSRAQRTAAMHADQGTPAASHGTEFHDGMLGQGRRELARGHLLALPAIDATLLCLQGELWLTRDGDIQDYILGAGSSLHLRPADQAVVMALQPSQLRLIAAAGFST